MDIHFELNGESFVWEERKAESNARKHGIRFEEAAWAFVDPLLVVVDASRNDEERDAVIGLDASGRLLFVVHIETDGEAIRIISARRAIPAEENLYAQ
ncbi:MAG: BrnT family toxin [Methylococcaceae bacterium]|nr:BrnT family toxin [Methylococcaceae bacterium]